ncbi:MAG: class SAM-dependent methyltransferase [Acidimicrobiales bacterium]|jgi:SAM-dependent methyltransferase|nr:class SAM-dependent methyltransferase [Acidimicrobiales bacterium]
MTVPHPALGDDEVAALRDEVGAGSAATPAAAAASDAAAGAAPSARARAATKAGIRRAIAWYVDETAQDTADRVGDRIRSEVLPRVARVEQRLDAPEQADPAALAVNVELLKGELRALQATLDALGMAIAPASGLPAAAARLAEVRERITALERKARSASATAPAPVAAPLSSASTAAPAPSAAFDYLGFERRFRGDSDAVAATQRERYLGLLRDHAPVLDIGCGRGELLAALGAEGVEALGVDLDADMAAEAQAIGLDVRHGDAIEFLRAREPGSLGAIVSFHVIEHLELPVLLELIDLATTRLRPGGFFVAETPNPASLVVLGNSYVLDPTHVRPLHPSLMVFLCESAGFRDVRLEMHAPAEGYHLPLVDDPDAPAWASTVNEAFAKLNDVLFGPQEYAVIATLPPTRGA